jgi:hypothetical protein
VAWSPPQIDGLPRVLAGPILRRVEGTSVTVFVALRTPANVEVRVFDGSAQVASAARAAVKLGSKLHVAAVTASAAAALSPGKTYTYDVLLDGAGLMQPGVWAATADAAKKGLTYTGSGNPALPSFAVPPADLSKLRIFHGSCRKANGQGKDALPILNSVIAASVAKPLDRPHQLLLTGDQIYADDVADTVLEVIQKTGLALFGRDEMLPKINKNASEVKPGTREIIAKRDAGLTADPGDSHLFAFPEFCLMYLLAWSDVLWPAQLPEYDDVQTSESPNALSRSRFNQQRAAVEQFKHGLQDVRRALANVPVLTMFDDHEVSDDWYITLSWCKAVAAPPKDANSTSNLGRRIVANALAAYAVFQAWGNTPERFAESGAAGAPGRALLDALSGWDGNAGANADEVARRVGLPQDFTEPPTGPNPDPASWPTPVRPNGALDWHYNARWGKHQVIALDTRTRRVYPNNDYDPPALLLTEAAFQEQVDSVPYVGDGGVTIVISGTPVFGHPLVIALQRFRARWLFWVEWLKNLPILGALGAGSTAGTDSEAWQLQDAAVEKLIAHLGTKAPAGGDGIGRSRVVVLSGDVHYGFVARAGYRAEKPYGVAGGGRTKAAIAQLTSSSLRNQGAAILQDIGFQLFEGVPTTRRYGWANAGGGSMEVGKWFFGLLPWTISGSPAVAEADDDRDVTAVPEWSYKINYEHHGEPDPIAARGGVVTPVSFPPRGDRRAALAQYLNATANHRGYMTEWGNGKEVVADNNIGEITFAWPEEGPQQVTQQLWWRLDPDGDAAPLTRLDADMTTDMYGDHALRRGDRDQSGTQAAIYGGTPQPAVANPPTFVKQLQRNLKTLGFALVGNDDGSFGRQVEWAVREFQIYAGMPKLAREKDEPAGPPPYSRRLEQVKNPRRYTGPVSGVVNEDTRDLISLWVRKRYRCPVVIEAWEMRAGQPHHVYVQAAGTSPPVVPGPKDNMWLHDEIDSTTPRVLVRDLSGYYELPAGHTPDFSPPHDDLRVLGDWVRFDAHFNGPHSEPPAHTWSEAELLPESLIEEGLTLDRLSPTQLSSFRVVRAVSEVECNAYFDSLNAFDNAFVSLGPCHWTLGIVFPSTLEEGELCGFLAYLRHADPDAFERAVERFGVRVDEDWVDSSGVPNGQPLFKGDRKYAGWVAQHDDNGNWVRLPLAEPDGDRFKTWHWYYRWAMAGRTIPGFRRRMWHMARVRLRDILSTPWGTTGVGGLPNLPDGTPITIGHVFTSEKATALLLRWHIRYPSRAVEGVGDGTQRAAQTMRRVFANAGLTGNPTTWGNVEEQALIDAIMDFPNWPPPAPTADFRTTMTQVHNWPIWNAAHNPKRFRLSPAAGPLSVERDSFDLDTAGLPPAPIYDTTI